MERLNRQKGPDFICVGPHKTGTDWMYLTIAQHPQVWMPPDKEIGYFWERVYLGKKSFYQRLTSPYWHHAHLRQAVKRRMRAHARSLFIHGIDTRSLLWAVKYFALPRSDAWYLSLFDRGKVSGDVSPNYYDLPEEEVERISQLLPYLKVIISLRNPVERLWSMAKMVLCMHQNKSPAEVSDQHFLDFFRTNTRLATAHYVHLIERWKKHFPPGNVLIIFIDELQEDPVLLFEKICQFLGLTPPDDRLKQRVSFYANKGIEGAIRPALGEYLYRYFQPSILELADYLPQVEYPRKWLTELREKYDNGSAETVK
jgi:hypothetical protein